MLEFFSGNDNLLDAQTVAVMQRFTAVANYGYSLTPTQVTALNKRIKSVRAVLGRIPALWHDAEFSVNRNALIFTEDISNAAWVIFSTAAKSGTNVINLPASNDGFYQATQFVNALTSKTVTAQYVLSGNAGETISLQFSQGGSGSTYTKQVTLTTTPTLYTFTQALAAGDTNTTIRCQIRREGSSSDTATTVTITKAMFEVSPTASTYQKRLDSTAVKSLNLGTAGVTGDGTYTSTNANNTSMLDFVGTRRVYKSVLSQNLLTGYTNVINANPRFMGSFAFNGTSTSEVVIVDVTGAGTDITIVLAGKSSGGQGYIREYASNVSQFLIMNADLGAVWGSRLYSFNGTVMSSYQNGGGKTTITPSTLTTGSHAVRFINSNGVVAGFSANHLIYDPNNYTDTQILNLHNALKADLGL